MSASVHAGIPHPQEQTHTPPPRADTPSPLGADTPLRRRYPPRSRHPPGADTPTRSRLRHTVNERPVTRPTGMHSNWLHWFTLLIVIGYLFGPMVSEPITGGSINSADHPTIMIYGRNVFNDKSLYWCWGTISNFHHNASFNSCSK